MTQNYEPDAAAAQLTRSWEANAAAWTRVVRNHEIESRRVATDAAIIAAVLERSPRRALDAGCGEGWLARALAAHGIDVVGFDGSAGLIANARTLSDATFLHLAYDEIIADPGVVGSSFDVVICNFSLMHEAIEPLLRAFGATLDPRGALIIQTLHPWTARGEEQYADGWRTETFAGLGADFTEPMPWYFRTIDSWTAALQRSGFAIERIIEPRHPETSEPLSLLIVGVLSEQHPFTYGLANV